MQWQNYRYVVCEETYIVKKIPKIEQVWIMLLYSFIPLKAIAVIYNDIDDLRWHHKVQETLSMI